MPNVIWVLIVIAGFSGLVWLGFLMWDRWITKRHEPPQAVVPWKFPGDTDQDTCFEIRGIFYLHEFDEEGVELKLGLSAQGMRFLYEFKERKLGREKKPD